MAKKLTRTSPSVASKATEKSVKWVCMKPWPTPPELEHLGTCESKVTMEYLIIFFY